MRLTFVGIGTVLIAASCAPRGPAVAPTYDHLPKSAVGQAVRLRGTVAGTKSRDVLRLPSGEVVSLDRSFNDAPDGPVVLAGKLLFESSRPPSNDLPSPQPGIPLKDGLVRSYVLRGASIAR